PGCLRQNRSALARRVFIQSALVEQQLDPDAELRKRARFWQHNLQLLEAVAAREARLRRRDLLLDDAALAAFYARNLSAEICSRAALAKWLRDCPESAVTALCLTEQEAQAGTAPLDLLAQFPTQLELAGQSYRLSYCFAPGAEADGVTLHLPATAVGALPLAALEWLVPGMLVDKCGELIRLLPKAQRKKLVPAAQAAAALCAQLQPEQCRAQSRSLYVELAAQVKRHYAVVLDPVAWRRLARDKLAEYYRMRVEITGPSGEVLFAGRDIPALQRVCLQSLQAKASQSEQAAAKGSVITAWDFGDLDQGSTAPHAGEQGYRALKQSAAGLVLGYSPSAADANAHTRQSLPQLAAHAMREQVRYLKKNTCKNAGKILPYVKIGDREQLVEDLIHAAIAHACFDEFANGMPRNTTEFERCITTGRGSVVPVALKIEQQLYVLLDYYQQVCARLHEKRGHFPVQCKDIEQQLAELVCAGFMQRTGARQLEQLPRYLEAILVRLDRLGGRVEQDTQLCEKLSSLQRPLHNLLYKYPQAIIYDEQVRQYRWLLEELRVSLFAQQLKTVVPVSIQRVSKAWQAIDLNHYPLAV
ncbi:MAG: DUF3418 domain-containing protein, partial [Gammaproteobacteria bacterium]|nr:DUF3418 domain-containing protein [Gammaproteobacteria bacterium]